MMEVNQFLMHPTLAWSHYHGGWARNPAEVRAYLTDRNRSAEEGARVPEEYR